MRELFGLRPAPEFADWLEARGVFRAGRLISEHGHNHPLIEQLAPVLTDPVAAS